MRIRGEGWENSIYPLLLGPLGRATRQLLPEALIIDATACWLRGGRRVLANSYFTAVRQAASLALRTNETHSFLSDHLRFAIQFYLEMASMIEAPRSSIKERLLPTITYNLSGLETALDMGRGILMPTVQTTVPLRMIFSEFPSRGRYNLLLHHQYEGIAKMLIKADPSWNFIFLEDAPARRVIEALRSGETVICNVDHVYPDTEVTLAPVLGHPAIVPSSIFRAAQRLNSLVLPLTFTEEREQFIISAAEIFDWNNMGPLPISQMLDHVHFTLDDAILRAPSRWFGWGNLMNRWCAWRDPC